MVSIKGSAIDEMYEGLIFPWDTGHRVKNHIMIRSEVKNETNTQASQSGIQARSGRLGGGAWLELYGRWA